MPDYPQPPKWAVYYGTITLDDGSVETYTADEVAALYNLGSDPYTAVPLVGANPFHGGINDPMSEVSFFHLKPLANQAYYDAHVRYNTTGAEYEDIDFDARTTDKWVHRQIIDESEDFV